MSPHFEKVMLAHRNHLSRDEWCYFDIGGIFEWPSGWAGYWFHRVDCEAIMIYVGPEEDYILNEDDLAGVSEGLAGLVRLAWDNGASWIYVNDDDNNLLDVPQSFSDEEEGTE